MKQYTLNGANMTTREDAHNELMQALEFPDYYGKNLDALNDCIEEMRGEITLINAAEMLNSLEAYGCRLLEVIFRAVKESEYITFRVEA